MESTVTLAMQDQQKHLVISRLAEGLLTALAAAELLGRSERQVRRMLAAYRREGLASIPHHNRGRRPANAIPPETTDRVVALCQGEGYRDCNNHHLVELLAERDGITLSVSSLRRIRQEAGVPSPRRHRAPKHRSRRERKPQPGMMLQIDASPHVWLGEAHPSFNLLATIDDATGEVHALFRESEDCLGYMDLMQQVIRRCGIPASLYSDRHTIFVAPKSEKLSLEDQLAGRDQPPTQFGRAVQALGIRIIPAGSPQAKGRVERHFGISQDRLVNELRLDKITTLEDANAFLPAFLKRYNARFNKPPADATSAFRPAPPKQQLAHILGLHFTRTVGNDNTVSFGNKLLAVTAPGAASYARKRITVHVAPDGQISFWHQDNCIGKGPRAQGHILADPSAIARCLPDPASSAAASRPKTRPPAQAPSQPVAVTPAKDHPWRRFRLGK